MLFSKHKKKKWLATMEVLNCEVLKYICSQKFIMYKPIQWVHERNKIFKYIQVIYLHNVSLKSTFNWFMKEEKNTKNSGFSVMELTVI